MDTINIAVYRCKYNLSYLYTIYKAGCNILGGFLDGIFTYKWYKF